MILIQKGTRSNTKFLMHRSGLTEFLLIRRTLLMGERHDGFESHRDEPDKLLLALPTELAVLEAQVETVDLVCHDTDFSLP